MEYRIYHNRIVLVDDDRLILGEVDFETPGATNLPSDTIKITHLYTDASLPDSKVPEKLMEKLLQYLEKHELYAIPDCDYATQWFSHHPEYAEFLYSAPKGETSVPRLQTLPEYTEETDTPSFAGGSDIPILQCLSRALQFLTTGAFVTILVLFFIPAIRYLEAFGSVSTMFSEGNITELSYVAGLSITGLYLLICIFWSLSRKRMITIERETSIDTGRGLTGALIMAILLFSSIMICRATTDVTLTGIVAGLRGTLYILSISANLSLKIAIVSFILCLIRKIIGA